RWSASSATTTTDTGALSFPGWAKGVEAAAGAAPTPLLAASPPGAGPHPGRRPFRPDVEQHSGRTGERPGRHQRPGPDLLVDAGTAERVHVVRVLRVHALLDVHPQVAGA